MLKNDFSEEKGLRLLCLKGDLENCPRKQPMNLTLHNLYILVSFL
jgi:hypothetical protein